MNKNLTIITISALALILLIAGGWLIFKDGIKTSIEIAHLPPPPPLSSFPPPLPPPSSFLFKETEQPKVIFHGKITEKTPTVIYSNLVSNGVSNEVRSITRQISSKKGNNPPEIIVPEIIDKANENASMFHTPLLIHEKHTILFPLSNRLMSIDIVTKEVKELFTSKSFLDQLFISKDHNRVLIITKEFEDEINYATLYNIYEYNLTTNTFKTLVSNKKIDFHTTAQWREDKNAVIAFGSIGDVSQPLFINLRSGNIETIPRNEFSMGYGTISLTGTYILVVSGSIDEDYNYVKEGGLYMSPSTYNIFDSITGQYKGTFGKEKGITEIIDFSPDDKEVLYSSVNKNTKTCYKTSLTGTQKTVRVDNYQALLAKWYPNRFESKYNSKDRTNEIFSPEGQLEFSMPSSLTFIGAYRE